MQNLEVKDAILTTEKTKSEIKKELEDSIENGKKNENMDIQQMTENCAASEEDAAKVIQEFEEIIRNKKTHIVWLPYHQGKILQKFRLKERFVKDIVSKFKISKSAIVFKIILSRLIDDYPPKKGFLLSLHYFLKNLKLIKKVCKENAREFK